MFVIAAIFEAANNIPREPHSKYMDIDGHYPVGTRFDVNRVIYPFNYLWPCELFPLLCIAVKIIGGYYTEIDNWFQCF